MWKIALSKSTEKVNFFFFTFLTVVTEVRTIMQPLHKKILQPLIFKALALWADAFYKLKCPSVCGSVCPFVCSLLSYRLNVFFPPLHKVGCQIFLEIQNHWGKVMERSGLRSKFFVWKWSKIAAQKKSFFFCWFCLTKHGGNHASQWIRDLWSKGVSLILAYL